MKIRITSLLTMLLLGVATSMAQLSWVYNGETLADGETLTVNENSMTLMQGFYIDIANTSSTEVSCTVTKAETENPNGFMIMMCIEGTCYPPTTETTAPFSIAANGTYEHFHVQVIGDAGEATTSYTVTDGTNTAVLNVIYVIDDDESNNGVTIGSASVNNIATAQRNVTLNNGILTVTGAKAGQKVRIIDLTGRVAASFTVNADTTQRYDLNLGRGIYLVALQENGRSVYAQKVINR